MASPLLTPYNQTDLESALAYVQGAIGDWTEVGQEAIRPRWLATSTSGTLTSGTIYFTYWTAYKAEQIDRVRTKSVLTRTGAATLMKLGTFSIHSKTKDLTLIGTTADFSGDAVNNYPTANTLSEVSYTTKPTTVIGQRYATGLLIVTANTMPTIQGLSVGTSFGVSPAEPRLYAALAGQADLPAIGGTIAASGLTSPLAVCQFLHLPPAT